MGICQRPLISSLEFLNKCDLSDPLWTKVLEKDQYMTRRRYSWLSRKANGGHMRKERCRRVLMKRRVRVEGYRRSSNEIERKVKILQKLIPKCDSSSSMGLERLFRETADYIWALEMRVKIMKIIVNVLSAPDSN
ncbi:transcription factor UPBEAT1 [Lycium ferocissimum]|uniref:transcription factor UPBEAT1 n=1 Tax=Lycium ferocissimum TaxID=112874 RepID=UPI0028153BE8|nr:transcription factor UPBEAT1 [Lycium ferocissimum]